MATKSTKSDWNDLLKDVQQTARSVREYIETSPPDVPGPQPALQEAFRTNAKLAYQELESAGMRLQNILATYEGKQPFAGQA